MKRTICFYFQVHQPFRLRNYRFFDIGNSHQYFDDFNNRSLMRKIADRCYLPMNQLLLDLIKQYDKKFKIAFSISGSALQQFELYAPEVLQSFKDLASTGCVEFIAETAAHSLSVVKNEMDFERQVLFHKQLIERHFNQVPTTFRCTELIYSDEIGAKVAALGFSTMLAEGARNVLGWKSPNFIYTNAIEPKLKVLLRNFRLSDDISFRFSDRGWAEWPVTSDKYVAWLNEIDSKEEVVNLFMDYETFGEHQAASTGIFEFMKHLPQAVFANSNFEFHTPSEVSKLHQPIAPIHVPFPTSWADEERDLSAWLGNELQDDAFNSLYVLEDKIQLIKDPAIIEEWLRLQTSDHFYYMCTKWFSDGNVHKYFNPYASPYEAYINYMNVLSDFTIRINQKIALQNTSNSVLKLNIDHTYASILTGGVDKFAGSNSTKSATTTKQKKEAELPTKTGKKSSKLFTEEKVNTTNLEVKESIKKKTITAKKVKPAKNDPSVNK